MTIKFVNLWKEMNDEKWFEFNFFTFIHDKENKCVCVNFCNFDIDILY